MSAVHSILDHLAIAALGFEEANKDKAPNAMTGNNPMPPNHANNVAHLPPPPNGPPQGPLAATTAGDHILAEVQEAALTYNILLGPNSTLTNQDRLEQIADQPHPFALLIICNPDSTPAIRALTNTDRSSSTNTKGSHAKDISVGCNNSSHMHHKTEYETEYKTKYETEYESH